VVAHYASISLDAPVQRMDLSTGRQGGEK
jgi:hypothetical protein